MPARDPIAGRRFSQLMMLKDIVPDLRFLRWRRGIVFGLSAAMGLSLLLSGAGSSLDHLLRSARDGLRSHAASGEVHIVEIDAQSLARIHRWPWPRGIHARAVDKLHQAGVRSIAFDVDFSSASDPAEDAKFAAALKRVGGNVILPTFQQAAGSGSYHSTESLPIKPLADNAFLAAVNVIPDPDGYVRQMLLGVETFGTARPSIPSMVAETKAEIGRSFEVDYSIEPATIPRHSLIDVINGQVPTADLAGKRIIIGATAIEMGDRYVVPRHGVIPGVVIQALAAETLLSGAVPQRWSRGWALALTLLLVGLVVRRGPRRRRLIMFGVGSAGILALPLWTEASFAVSLPLAAALPALLAAGVAGGIALLMERYHQRALADEETGLPNLAALEAALGGRGGGSIVIAHINRFAEIASGLGPAATAQLVLRVSERLKFTNADRIVFRPDEASLAWIEAPEDEETVGDRIEAIAALMRAPVECGCLVDVTLSFGLATGEGIDAKHLAANASLAAARASRKGIRWSKFVDADSDETHWHLSLLGELDAAMASGQVWNAYQPKLDLATGRIVGVEALVRWLHPQRGPIAPDSFISLLEEHGRVRELTTHVLAQALEDARVWDAAGHSLGVAVNVSATLLADHGFIEQVGQMLQANPLPPERITIEITETAAINSADTAVAALESWRALGVNVSIDDYGTGQSSLGYLQKLPASELKIDRSFIQTVNDDHRNAIMVRSTIALAHELGMKVVAEGIEDEDCLKALAEMGCDTGQGYFISRPVSAAAVMDLVAEKLRKAA
jgi:EAL domain-containing protein (putative c-di-GMP-specific phosphodiesterase class I)/CHASE2 domain-containing sensor protein